jgi:hypothetical protein
MRRQRPASNCPRCAGAHTRNARATCGQASRAPQSMEAAAPRAHKLQQHAAARHAHPPLSTRYTEYTGWRSDAAHTRAAHCTQPQGSAAKATQWSQEEILQFNLRPRSTVELTSVCLRWSPRAPRRVCAWLPIQRTVLGASPDGSPHAGREMSGIGASAWPVQDAADRIRIGYPAPGRRV